MKQIAATERSPSRDSLEGSHKSEALPLEVVDRSALDSRSFFEPVRSLRRYSLLAGIVMTAVAVGGVIGLYRQPPGLQWVMKTLGLEPGAGTSAPIAVPPANPSAPPIIAKSNGVIALGRLVPASKIVTIAPASGVRDARIADLKVSEGQKVARGEVLAILDNEQRLAAAVAAARSMVAVREAAVEQTRASIRASLEEARAILARAEATALRARQEFERTESLFKKGIASQSAYDQKLAALREAQKEIERQQATLSRYEREEPDDQPDVILARRNFEAAKADLERAIEEREQAFVRAPIAGTVLQINARTGEKPGEAGVLELGNIAQMTAELDVYQSQIGQVEIGDPATISAVALPDVLRGKVSRIGLRVKRQSAISQDPAANTDARVVEAIVDLDEPSSQIASRLTGLQVEARIMTGDQ
jgi:HlyD family secretion protein